MKRSESDKVNIATLKAQLAKYLRMVRAGKTIIVTDHKHAVARLMPFESESSLETIKPELNFSEVFNKLDIPELKNGIKTDVVSTLLKERGNR